MNIDLKNSFSRDIKKITDPLLKEQIEQVILSVKKASKTSDISELKKLKGFKVFYRIKLGNYRIGVAIKNDTVIFAAFAHRKDFYQSYP